MATAAREGLLRQELLRRAGGRRGGEILLGRAGGEYLMHLGLTFWRRTNFFTPLTNLGVRLGTV